VRDADLVLLPYDSKEQVTSGVLIEAVAAGKPVVSTAFPHAVELLSSGAGLLVPQRDPVALSAALRRVLTEDGLATRMAAESRRLAPSLLWPAVATKYVELAWSLIRATSRSVA
jgi:glycosyltransferase involved in cell wall biosynthesis